MCITNKYLVKTSGKGLDWVYFNVKKSMWCFTWHYDVISKQVRPHTLALNHRIYYRCWRLVTVWLNQGSVLMKCNNYDKSYLLVLFDQGSFGVWKVLHGQRSLLFCFAIQYIVTMVYSFLRLILKEKVHNFNLSTKQLLAV